MTVQRNESWLHISVLKSIYQADDSHAHQLPANPKLRAPAKSIHRFIFIDILCAPEKTKK